MKYMLIKGGAVQSLDIKTFLMFAAAGLLLQAFYWFFALRNSRQRDLGGHAIANRDKSKEIGNGTLPLIAFALLYAFLYFGLGYDWMLFSRSKVFLEEISSTAAFLSFFVKSIPCFVALAVVEKAIRRNQRPNFAILLTSYLLLLIFNNPINTPRFLSLGCLILPMLPYLVRGNWLGVLFVFFPAVISALLPVTSLMRDGWENVDFDKVLDFFGTAEFSAMFVFNDAILYLGEAQFTQGNHTLSALMVFIPRAIWPSKNSGTGIEVAENLSYRFTNVGIPPLYDFYLDFGYSGVGIFAFLMAVVIFKAQQIWKQQKGGVFQRSMPFVTFILMPIFLRGDFSTACVVAYSLISSSWFVAMIFRIKLIDTQKDLRLNKSQRKI